MNCPVKIKNWKKIWIPTVLILGVLNFAFIDHLTDYHVVNPAEEDNREKESARRESEEKGCSSYTDSQGNEHVYIDGGELA